MERRKDKNTERKSERKSERLKNRKRKRQEDIQKVRKTEKQNKEKTKRQTDQKEKEISFSQDFSGPHNKLESFFTENKLFQTNDSKSQRQVRSKPDCIWLSSVR